MILPLRRRKLPPEGAYQNAHSARLAQAGDWRGWAGSRNTAHATRRTQHRAQRFRTRYAWGSPWRGGRSEGPAAEARCFGAATAHCAQSFSSILRSSQRRTGGGLWREIHTCILRNQAACAVGAVRQSLSPMGWSKAYRSAVRTGDHLVEDAAECPQIRCKTVNASVL
jgi:hypothetical protein